MITVFKEYIKYKSADGESTINAFAVYPENPWMILQIVHGIAEHIERYVPFAEELAGRGIAVFAEDHLGHGKSADGKERLAWFAEKDGWDKVCADILTLKGMAEDKFPDIPYVLFGHSMGSFLSRTIATKNSHELDGLILSGTGWQGGGIIKLGKLAAKLEGKRLGSSKKPSKVIDTLAFSAYNKKFKPNKTAYDWLSTDENEVQKYIDDELCGFTPSPSLFWDMLDGLDRIRRKKIVAGIRADLPIYIFSGDMDPVGAMGKGVQKVYELYKNVGLENVEMKLYLGGRHELLNDTYRSEVISDILNWLNNKVKRGNYNAE